MSNITLGKVFKSIHEMDSEYPRCEKFINSERLNNDLLSLPFMNMDFQYELECADIFTVNQLIGVFASYNFQYPISRNHFLRMDERLLLCLFYRLGMMGFTLPEVKCECDYLEKEEGDDEWPSDEEKERISKTAKGMDSEKEQENREKMEQKVKKFQQKWLHTTQLLEQMIDYYTQE